MYGLKSALAFLSLLLIFALTGCGKVSPDTPARILKINGTVEVKQGLQGVFAKASENDMLTRGCILKTGEGSSATLEITGKGIVEIRANTAFELDPDNNSVLQNSGSAIYKIDKTSDSFKVITPQGITSVLGTRFMVTALEATTIVGVEEGRVSFTTSSGEERILNAKEKAVIDSRGFVGGLTLFDINSDAFNYLKIDGKWVPKEMNEQK